MQSMVSLMVVPMVVWVAVWGYLWSLDRKVKRIEAMVESRSVEGERD